MSRRAVPLIVAQVLVLLGTAPAAGQVVSMGDERGPRFLYAASAGAPATRVDARMLPVLRQRLAVRIDDEPIGRALERVSALTGLRFVYSPDAVPVERRVTLIAARISLAAVLTELLLDAGVDVVVTPTGHVALVPQQEPRAGTVDGRVVDAATGAPIANAGVQVIGRSLSAVTDAQGRFRLLRVPPGIVQLRVSALGFAAHVQADVVVGSGKPAWVLVELRPTPVALMGIAVGPGWFVAPADAPTSTQRLSVEEIRRSPGAQEDVVRAVSLLPGVAPTAIHRNDLIVRGGAPYENLFIVDGLEVPNINHFAAQGSSGGQVSLLNLDFLNSVEFSAGGFGAAQGDRVGSVTTLTLREGIRERHGGEVNLAATGFGVMAEGPVGRGSYLAGVRRSYLDLILEAAGEPFFVHYWDLNVKVVQELGQRDRLAWTFVGGLDDWGFNLDTPENRYDAALMAVNDDQYFSGLTWSHAGDDSRLQLTLGRIAHSFLTFQNDTLGQRLFTNRSKEAENSARLSYARTWPSGATLDLGTTVKYADRLAYDVTIPGYLRVEDTGTQRPLDLDTSFTAMRVGTWAEAEIPWSGRVSTRLGARLDYYPYLEDAIRIAPRLAATLDLGGDASLNLSGGRYWQTPSYIWLAGDPSNGTSLEPFRVDQLVVGFQKLLRDDLKLQVEAYRKRYAHYPTRVWRPEAVLVPGIESVEVDIPFGLEPLTSEGTGSATGVEVFLQKRLSDVPVYGVASLSLNSTEFEALDGQSRISAFDMPVAASLAAGWRPGARWDLGMRFRVASGLPRTAYVESGPDEGRIDFTRYNDAGRMPTFHALDVRVDRRWAFHRLQLTAYIDILDIYNRNNPIAYVWDYRKHAARYEEAIGFLPSLGINVEF